MKHRTKILKTIAYMHKREELCDAGGRHIRSRTMMRPSAINTVIAEMIADGLVTVDDGYIFLTKRGWEQFERDKPRVVSADMLVSHADGGTE